VLRRLENFKKEIEAFVLKRSLIHHTIARSGLSDASAINQSGTTHSASKDPAAICDKVRSILPEVSRPMSSVQLNVRDKLRSLLRAALLCGLLSSFAPLALTLAAQQRQAPVVVQPGAPGEPTKTLPSSTKAKLPPPSPKDVQFMQGMIMHHAQAVEMTALIDSHTQNKQLHLLGARISKSQSSEINFMKRWLLARGESTSEAMPDMPGMDMSTHELLMPGMLTAKQMEALRNAKGAEFDHLFLTGMIQHHGGALTMVKELFDTAGAGQDAEIFNFATDVDSGQRAEIRIMQTMLDEHP
jgi:uncharacterized protein (DUF305 family)